MKLLDVKTVTETANEANRLKQKQVRDLQEELTAITKKVNQARAEAEQTIASLATKLLVVSTKQEETISRLKSEVADLEGRRREALRPIHDKIKEADKKAAAADALYERAAATSQDSAVLYKEAQAYLDKLTEDRDEVDARLEDVIAREAKVALAEGRLTESTSKLSAAWVDFHKTVSIANATLASKEAAVEQARLLVDRQREANRVESIRLTTERRAIHDSYLALAEAKRHLSIP